MVACAVPKDLEGEILDIGSGSGIISLAVAQLLPKTKITAVEIDEEAHLQSLQNFQNSEWANRLNAVHESIQEYAENANKTFDGIVCNPPFFKSNENLSGARKTARQDQSLSFEHLLSSVDRLLSENGKFICIVPFERSKEIINIGSALNLYLINELKIKGKEHLNPKRSILIFSRKPMEICQQSFLTVYETDGNYTSSYKKMTKEFYLKF